MPRDKAKHDTETLEMALLGFEQKRLEIEEKIVNLRGLLNGKAASPAPANASIDAPVRKKRTLSAAARKRIALAQKKRWAEHHKRKAEAAK